MLTNVKCTRDVLTFTLCGPDAKKTERRLRDFIQHIPTFAIHDVRVKRCMENEQALAHALGLVPVVYNYGTYVPSDPILGFRHIEDCTCMGQRCPTCAIMFTCEVNEDRIVYSHDFKSTQQAELMPNIVLCRGPVVAIAFAVLGSNDVKHQCSAPLPYWTHPVHVFLNPDIKMSTSQKQELIKCCPSKVFEMRDMEDVVVNPTRICIGCDECVKKGIDFFRGEEEENESTNLVKIEYENETFDFVVESAGQLRPDTIWLYIQKYFTL